MKRLYYPLLIFMSLSIFSQHLKGQSPTRLGTNSGTMGTWGTFIGSYAGYSNQYGSYNTALGASAHSRQAYVCKYLII